MYNYSAVDLYTQIEQLLVENNSKAIFDLAKTISGNDELWNIFEKLIIFYLHNLLCQTSSSAERNDTEKVFIVIDKINNVFSATKNLNLDKSQSIINIFYIIKNAKN